MSKLNYKKCKHDNCRRKATSSGYCEECIEINVKKCMYCSQEKKATFILEKDSVYKKMTKSDTTQKPKHNFWINGLEKGRSFFHFTQSLGSGLFFVIVFLTCIYLWGDYIIRNIESQALVSLGVFFLFLFRLIFYLFFVSFLLKYLCTSIATLLRQREEKALLKEGEKKYVNN